MVQRLNVLNVRHNAERQKANFPKESVENADLYKPALNEIMTTHQQFMKDNFVAPLTGKNRDV